MRALIPVLCIPLTLAAATTARAQRVSVESIALSDTSAHHEVRLRDGSRLVGRVTATTSDSLTIELSSGAVTVSRNAINEIRQFSASQLHNGEYWAENPNPTRLLFSSTAFSLARGSGYYWNAWLFLNGFAVGVTDRITVGGGMTLFPSGGVKNNFYFVTPKVTVTRSTGPQVAVGALAGSISGESLGILYGVSSFGSREHNLSVGLGWGYVGSELASSPIVMIGGQTRASKRVALITENWFIPSSNGHDGVLSYGLRFLGEKLSVDLAFMNLVDEPIFPGVPWIGFAVKF